MKQYSIFFVENNVSSKNVFCIASWNKMCFFETWSHQGFCFWTTNVWNQHETTSASFFQVPLLMTQHGGHQQPLERSIKTKKITLNHLAHTIFAMVSSTRWAPDPVISGVMGLWGPYRWLSRLRTEVILPYLLGLFHLIYIWIRDPSCIKLG